MTEIYIYRPTGKIRVPSLRPFLRTSLEEGIYMDSSRMEEADRVSCLWKGFGIGKGVTHPRMSVSLFAVPQEIERGLHATLLKDWPGIDPFPLCYDARDHMLGFGGFIRWVYFADPQDCHDFIGIDYSLAARPTSGVAHSMRMVSELVGVLARHGVPEDAEVALLNWRMCEESFLTKLRYELDLIYVQDWVLNSRTLFGEGSVFCPRCGLRTLDETSNYCFRCGCKPTLFWKGGDEHDF